MSKGVFTLVWGDTVIITGPVLFVDMDVDIDFVSEIVDSLIDLVS